MHSSESSKPNLANHNTVPSGKATPAGLVSAAELLLHTFFDCGRKVGFLRLALVLVFANVFYCLGE